MSIRLRRQRDGVSWRPHWYGSYVINGKESTVNLNIAWKGVPPDTMRDRGDMAFERSRVQAEDALQRIKYEAQQKGRSEHLTERLIQSKTGREIEYVLISELSKRWRSLPRKAKPSEAHLKNCDAHFARFTRFMEFRNEAEFLYEVDEQDAAAFSDSLSSELSPATARYAEKLIGNAFARFLPVGAANPFSAYIGKGLKSKPIERVHRVPFTTEQLGSVYKAAADHDPELLPLIITAACTGLRRGDVCRLRWEFVNLKNGLVCVTTSKTGRKVWIPIFQPFRHVLEATGPKLKGFVFPVAAALLHTAEHQLSVRLKKVIAHALSPRGTVTVDPTEKVLPVEASAASLVDEGRSRILGAIAPGSRRDSVLDTFLRYSSGQSLCSIAKATGKSKGTVSERLHAAQAIIGVRFIPDRPGRRNRGNMNTAISELTRVQRSSGRNRASIYDWHAFRTTWITLALAAGVPIETVRKVTGHATVDVVQEYYFQPDQKHFIAAFTATGLSEALKGGREVKELTQDESGSDLENLAARIAKGTATNKEKKRFKELAAAVD